MKQEAAIGWLRWCGWSCWS